MTAINLEAFGGMIPGTDDRLLPNSQAEFVENCWLYSGTVYGFHDPVPIYTLINPKTKKVFRIPKTYPDREHIVDSWWMEFQEPYTDVIRNPTSDDQYGRYYWAQHQKTGSPVVPPQYNTRDRIINGNPSYVLGIPKPATKPTIAAVAQTPTPLEERTYVYTWISAYGEEGPPSPPSNVTKGSGSATWNITVTAPTAANLANRNLTTTRIYRTIVSAQGTATYYFVADLPIATLTYADSALTTVVSQGNVLQSTFWYPPPDDLDGWQTMPNGIIVGWRRSEVWFSEPYRPHAWPPPYMVTTEYPIVGIGVIDQTAIVCTNGNPYAISGVNPSQMAQSRLAQYEPCTSRGSILSTPIGVAYSSPNGLCVAIAGEVRVATRAMIGKDDWQSLLVLPSLRAAAVNGGYYCWGSTLPGAFEPSAFDNDSFALTDYSGSYVGGFIDLNDSRVAYHTLYHATPTENVITDVWTGEVLMIRDGKVVWLDIAPTRKREKYIWRSKRFNMMFRKNLAAMKVWFEVHPTYPQLAQTRNVALQQDFRMDEQYGLVRVYADDRLVYTNELRTPGELMRLPSGFQAQYYQFEVEAQCEVYKIEVASSVKELTSV